MAAVNQEDAWAVDVLSALERLGACNGYLWPPETGRNRTEHPGYSYDVPKEEQVRAYLVRALEQSGDVLAEVDWTWYRSPKSKWKLDIATFAHGRRTALPVHLIEVKRVWTLPRLRWVEKPPELVASLTQDLHRLAEVRDEIVHQFHAWSPQSIGLFVLEIVDNPDATFDFGDLRAKRLTDRTARLTADRGKNVRLTLRAHWVPVPEAHGSKEKRG